jgi:CheY-like chemotaxis protein
LPRIFDSFFTTKPAGAGTGLGLSIVHQIITQHGGGVFAESRPGGGARMVMVLPMFSSSPAAPLAIIPEMAKPEQVNTCQERPSIPSGAKILVVEDERIVAELIRDVLREDGYIVDMVRDGREGFSHLSQRPYDLVICDVRTPGLDGPALCETLAATTPSLHVPILFITGDTMSSRTVHFLETSGLPWLAKPFRVEELRAAVAECFAHGDAEIGNSSVPSQSVEGHPDS